MEEEEAEAVLLALGPVLEWKGDPQKGWKAELGQDWESYLVEPKRWESYLVEPKRHWRRSVYKAAHLWPMSYHPKRFKTADEAKAACERHHATGRWE